MRVRAVEGLLVALVAAYAACSDRAGPHSGPRAAGRNILLVVIDTLRTDRLPFYGGDPRTAPL
jgi:hypothetical protein